jgi:hypothetical protein
MRPIKFRGRTGSGWITSAVGDANWASFWTDVDPTTVAQWIGLSDSTGSEIYEGDVLAYRDHRGRVEWQPGYFEIHWIVQDGDRGTLSRHIQTWNAATELTVVSTDVTADGPGVSNPAGPSAPS